MLISWSIYYQLVQYSQIFDASTVATKSVREKIVKPWFDRRKECWVAGWVAGCWCCSMVDWSRWFTIHVNLQSRKSVPERFPNKYCNNFSILVSYNSSWYVVFYPQHFDIDAYRCKRKIGWGYALNGLIWSHQISLCFCWCQRHHQPPWARHRLGVLRVSRIQLGRLECFMYTLHIWVFQSVSFNGGTPKTPQNDHFLAGKTMVVGYHHFRKLP